MHVCTLVVDNYKVLNTTTYAVLLTKLGRGEREREGTKTKLNVACMFCVLKSFS